MKLTTGFNYRKSSSSHTSPFSPIASYFRHDARSTRRPKRRDELTSPPSQQLQPPHHLFIRMSSLSIPSASNVAIPTPVTHAQPLVKSTTTAVACTTTRPCVEDQGDPIIQPEIPEPNLPSVTLPDHSEAAGPHRTTMTTDPGLAAGGGRATPPSTGRHSHHSTSPSPLTNCSHHSPNQSPWKTGTQFHTAKMTLSHPQCPCSVRV